MSLMETKELSKIIDEAGCWDRYISNKMSNILKGDYIDLNDMIMDDEYLMTALVYVKDKKSKECSDYYFHIYGRMHNLAFDNI